MVTYTSKLEAKIEADMLRAHGAKVMIVQTLIARKPAPFKSVYGWQVWEVAS